MFAAWFELHEDRVVADRPTALRVYAYLVANPAGVFEKQDVKAWLIAEQRKISPTAVNKALDLLIERGYVISYGRGQNNVRRVAVAPKRAA